MSAEEYREKIMARMSEKKEIEQQIEQLTTVLNVVNNHNGDAPDDKILNYEDFPGSTTNFFEVRLAQAYLHKLRNDCAVIQDKISDDLRLYYAAVDLEADLPTQPQSIDTHEDAAPIAVVNLVQTGSPAETAGLLNGDKIIEFGFVNEENFTGVKDIESVLQQCEGYKLKIIVDRDGNRKSLNIKPSKWSGNGLLGCVVLSP